MCRRPQVLPRCSALMRSVVVSLIFQHFFIRLKNKAPQTPHLCPISKAVGNTITGNGKFLYDLYRHWFQRNQPSGRMLGRNAFYESIEGLAEEQGWQLQERVRSTGRMDFPEPLILEYEVTEWMNKTYRGSDNDRRCMPELNDSYRGYVRISTAFFDGSYDIDGSTIKEE